MTNEERDRRLSIAEMDLVDLGIAYEAIGNAVRLFGPSVRSTRPNQCETIFEQLRGRRARADAEFERLEEEIFEANVGVTNDGPDRWTRGLDELGRNNGDERKK